MPEQRELNHLQRYLVEEAVEDFQHGQLTRRQALKMIAGVLGSLAAANTLLAACAPTAPPSTPPPALTASGGVAPASPVPASTPTAAMAVTPVVTSPPGA